MGIVHDRLKVGCADEAQRWPRDEQGPFSGRVAGGDGRGFVVALDKGRTGTGAALMEARR
jgi:hypothetical protein